MCKSNRVLEMTSGADGSCPLLNEYKQEYLRSRLPQTVLGGVRVRNVPCKGVISQIFMLLFPFIFAVILTSMDYYVDGRIFFIRVGLCGLLTVLLTIVNFIPRSAKGAAGGGQEPHYRFNLEEEEQVSLDTTLDLLNFIFPKNKTLFYKFADPILYAVALLLSLEVSNSSVQSAVHISDGGFAVLWVFLWVSYCIGLYSLVSNHPPEVAQYSSHDSLGLAHLYRPFYITVPNVVILLLTLNRSGETGEWYINSLQSAEYNIVMLCYILISLLPCLFFIGVLPPLDCLYSWLTETWLVLFCGASPVFCERRKLLQLAVTSVAVAATYYEVLLVPVLLLPLMCCNVLAWSKEVYKSLTLWVTVLYSTVTSVGLAVVISYYSGEGEMNTQALEVLIVLLCVVMVLVAMSSRVYWCNLIRNPVYGSLNKYANFYRRFWRVEQFFHPLLLSFYLYSTLANTVTSSDSFLFSFTIRSGLGWFNSVLVCRAIRLVWQDSRHSLKYISLYIIICNFYTNSTEPVLVMWICSFVIRYSDKVLQLLHFCFKLQLDALLLKKQRRPLSLKLAVINLLLSPLLLCIILISAVIGAPLLPLFTLPLYLLSYPRPVKFGVVNTSHSPSPDTARYRQIAPLLIRSHHIPPDHLTPGSFYLSRTENLLIVSQVLESGLGYSYLSVKGLELQETSCHTEEANIIKEIFDQTFHSNKCMNDAWLHVMEPLSMTHIETYSDARNVLTGVLDSPACLKSIPNNFMKCLTYFLCKEKVEVLPQSVVFSEQNSVSNKPAVKVGFDFTGLQSKAKSSLSEVDNEQITVKQRDKVEEDFLDNLSFGSEDSWYNTVQHNVVVVPNTVVVSHKDSSIKDSEVLVNRTVHEVEGWGRLPYTKSEVKDVDISEDVLSFYCNKYNVSDELKEVVKWITCAASVAVNGKTGKTANQVVKIYQGHVEWGKHSEWLNDNPELKGVITQAYQHAVKVSIDELIFGVNETVEEFSESLTHLTSSHYIGLESDTCWGHNITHSTPTLFTLYYNNEGVYSSRTLTLTTLPLYTGQLNTEIVRGIWTALSLELLYLTNDDEERYSIQAHPNLLRNVITQAADVPLGYPIYVSGALSRDNLV